MNWLCEGQCDNLCIQDNFKNFSKCQKKKKGHTRHKTLGRLTSLMGDIKAKIFKLRKGL